LLSIAYLVLQVWMGASVKTPAELQMEARCGLDNRTAVSAGCGLPRQCTTTCLRQDGQPFINWERVYAPSCNQVQIDMVLELEVLLSLHDYRANIFVRA
jgi:hypothetical protein